MNDHLIGTADLAVLLDHPARTIQWLRTQPDTAFPPSELTIDQRGTWICRASTALAWARDTRGYDGPVPEPMPLPDLVSTAYVREVTGYARKTVQAMCLPKRKDGRDVAPPVLPPPAATVSRVPLWERDTINDWWAARNGQPSEADQRAALVAALTKEPTA